jgi:hypothetical protein
MCGYGLAIDSIVRRKCDDPVPPIFLAVAATDGADLASLGNPPPSGLSFTCINAWLPPLQLHVPGKANIVDLEIRGYPPK